MLRSEDEETKVMADHPIAPFGIVGDDRPLRGVVTHLSIADDRSGNSGLRSPNSPTEKYC